MLDIGDIFYDFSRETVDLTATETERAREAANDLRWELWDLGCAGEHLPMLSDRPTIYGSFGRRTKTRPLDDIDLLVPFSADTLYISPHMHDPFGLLVTLPDHHTFRPFLDMPSEGYELLNSSDLLTMLKRATSRIHGLERAEIKGNGQAVSIWQRNVAWKYDLVPALPIRQGGVLQHYLIPNGVGEWWRTRPETDQDRLEQVEVRHGTNMHALVRVLKFWNVLPGRQRIGSYLLESLILSVFESRGYISMFELHLACETFFEQAAKRIFETTLDPKGLGPALDVGLNWEQRLRWSDRANMTAYYLQRAREEHDHDMAKDYLIDAFGPDLGRYV